MRVNSNYHTQLLNSINAIQVRQESDLQRLATGKRVNTPSDNPTAAAQEVANLASTADAAQYQQNISTTQTMLQSASSALNTVVTSLTKAISRGVEAANGMETADQRTQIAATISGIRDQIIGLANTSVQGVYLFGGTASGNAPFKLDSTLPAGVANTGNSYTNTVPVGNNQTVQSNIPGDQIFMSTSSGSGNVMKSLTDLVNALQSNSTSAIETATSDLQNAVSTVSIQQESYSSIINRLTSDNTSLQNETVTLKSQENNLVGADQATVITDLTQAQMSLQAALQATAKVVPMSLLNYL